jgi:hypothetical protein
MKPEPIVPAALVEKCGPNTAGTETDRGTGVSDEPRAVQAADSHWLKWNTLARTITGCQCGFQADESSDCGFGDSVVAHLLDVGAGSSRPVHLREAADSLAQIADAATAHTPEWRDGVRYAASLLRHTADDLTEGDTA